MDPEEFGKWLKSDRFGDMVEKAFVEASQDEQKPLGRGDPWRLIHGLGQAISENEDLLDRFDPDHRSEEWCAQFLRDLAAGSLSRARGPSVGGSPVWRIGRKDMVASLRENCPYYSFCSAEISRVFGKRFGQ